PFAFESICDVLGIEASYLRRVLLRSVSAAEKPVDAAKPDQRIVHNVRLLRLVGNTHTRTGRRNETAARCASPDERKRQKSQRRAAETNQEPETRDQGPVSDL